MGSKTQRVSTGVMACLVAHCLLGCRPYSSALCQTLFTVSGICLLNLHKAIPQWATRQNQNLFAHFQACDPPSAHLIHIQIYTRLYHLGSLLTFFTP